MKKSDIHAGMRIVVKVLISLGACAPARKSFHKAYPKGLILNAANLNRVYDLLDTEWFIHRVLYQHEHKQYRHEVWKAFMRTGTWPMHSIFIAILKKRQETNASQV